MATALHELARPLGNPIRWRTWDVFGGTQPGRGHKIQGHFGKRVAEKVSRSARSAFCFGRMTIDGGASGAGRRAFVSPEVSSRRHTPCHDRLAPPDGSWILALGPWRQFDYGNAMLATALQRQGQQSRAGSLICPARKADARAKARCCTAACSRFPTRARECRWPRYRRHDDEMAAMAGLVTWVGRMDGGMLR